MKRFLIITFALALVGASVTNARAQGIGYMDYLLCYPIKASDLAPSNGNHLDNVLVLNLLRAPPLSSEIGCHLLPRKNPRPIKICTPTEKSLNQLPDGLNLWHDYFVYRMSCPPLEDVKQGYQDEFLKGEAEIRRDTTRRELMVPAYRIMLPPNSCEPYGPFLCGGPCPNPLEECAMDANGVCGCQ